MPRKTTTVKYGYLGDQRLTLTSCVFDGEVLDTRVQLGSHTICIIAGSQRDEFLADLGDLIDTYRI